MKKIISLSFVILLFAACGGDEVRETPDQTPVQIPPAQDSPPMDSQTPSIQPQVTPQRQEPILLPQEVPAEPLPEEAYPQEIPYNQPQPTIPKTGADIQPHPERFGTMDGYLNLVLDPQTDTNYEALEPNGVTMIRTLPHGGNGFGRYELWGPSDWQSNPTMEQLFYIKSYTPRPSAPQPKIGWFGPFKGNLEPFGSGR